MEPSVRSGRDQLTEPGFAHQGPREIADLTLPPRPLPAGGYGDDRELRAACPPSPVPRPPRHSPLKEFGEKAGRRRGTVDGGRRTLLSRISEQSAEFRQAERFLQAG